jgi:two-component system phosphate regulon response regulator PhoB
MKDLVLVVEDEHDLLSTIQYNLERENYRTSGATCGTDAVERARELAPSLVILDLNLPDMSGFEVCRQLRGSESCRTLPIMVLSARNDEIDRVVAFELGVDDYMAKPFSTRELLLRVHSILRRASAQLTVSSQGSEGDAERIEHGPIAVDVQRRCGFVAEAEIELTNLEFELLKTLLERPGRVQTRARLLADVWRTPEDTATRTVDTHVKRLRQKLGDAGKLIRTVRGLGYCLGELAP